MQKVQVAMKRGFDIIGSILVLLMLSPFIILVAIAVKIGIRGSVIFKQERVGKNGKLFNIYKFRTMRYDKRLEENQIFSNDEGRINIVGKVLRRLKLDEIPQLINVLKGDMSLVGPRPTVQRQVDKYTDHQKRRLEFRPGITGLAQINGGRRLSWPERIELDIKYIESYRLFMDIKILFKTIFAVLFNKDPK